MRMMILAGAAMLTAMASPAAAADREINYPEGSLGYSALVAGDYEAARAMIETDDAVALTDPARLLNLGFAYERLGNTEKAALLYQRALESRENKKLILANGDVADSRDLAADALKRVARGIASS